MRLDIDNMTYEVRLITRISSYCFLFSSFFCWLGNWMWTGATCFRRKNWECQHRTVWRCDVKIFHGDDVQWYEWRRTLMCHLSCKWSTFLCLDCKKAVHTLIFLCVREYNIYVWYFLSAYSRAFIFPGITLIIPYLISYAIDRSNTKKGRKLELLRIVGMTTTLIVSKSGCQWRILAPYANHLLLEIAREGILIIL